VAIKTSRKYRWQHILSAIKRRGNCGHLAEIKWTTLAIDSPLNYLN